MFVAFVAPAYNLNLVFVVVVVHVLETDQKRLSTCVSKGQGELLILSLP